MGKSGMDGGGWEIPLLIQKCQERIQVHEMIIESGFRVRDRVDISISMRSCS